MEQKYYNLRDEFRFIKPIYIGIIILIVVSIISGILEINYLGDYSSSTYLSAFSKYVGIAALLQLILRLAGFILFLIMFYKAYKNISNFNNGETATTPGMAVAYYFIPILFLYKPYQTMRETYEWSFNGETTIANTTIITLWWTLFILSIIVSRVFLKLTDEQTYLYIYLASDIVDLFLFVIELRI